MEKRDFKVKLILNKKLLINDICKLIEILRQRKINCIISASNNEEAVLIAKEHCSKIYSISDKYFLKARPKELK